jgi:spermidine/putrescine-binding protein
MPRLIPQLLAGGAVAVLLALTPDGAKARDLTVVSFGGAYQDAQREIYFKPFTQQTGIKLPRKWPSARVPPPRLPSAAAGRRSRGG